MGSVPAVATEPPATDVLAHLGHYVATLGFFVPAAILIGFVVFAVVRDRRLNARERAEEDRREGMAREEIPIPPPAD
jgi:hypothetical protein